MAHVVFGKILYQLCHFYAAWQIVIVVNGQRLKSNVAIWSQWVQLNFATSTAAGTFFSVLQMSTTPKINKFVLFTFVKLYFSERHLGR